MSRTRSTEGFSLVEMLVALAIISLSAGIAYNGVFWRKSRETLGTLSQKISHAAAEASLRAVSKGETTRVVVDVTNRRINGGQDTDEIAVPEPFKMGVLTGAELIEQGTLGTIEFYGDGTSSGGEIVIEEPKGGARSVRIYWLTGAITVSDGPRS
jgi:prepilin-type N-terminal cleavage/methylation domain-containing protein